VSTENKPHAGGGGLVPDLMETLSRRAEAALSQRADCSPEAFAALSPEAARQLLHDLQVRQIELELQNEELRLLQREDTPLRAHLVVSAVQDDDGVSELRMVLSEITERKRLEQALRESESFKSSILDSLDAEFAIVDRNGLILDVNRKRSSNHSRSMRRFTH